jgi:hypothetical protein
MAARKARTAVFRDREPYREVPGAERDRVPDMTRIIRCMGVMACPAGPSLFLVHVHVVQVLVAVPEPRQSSGFRIEDQRFFMAVKAELVVVDIEGRIENRREIFSQHPEIIRTVRIMARGAITLKNWAMGFFIHREIIFHINYFTVRCVEWLVMAHVTGRYGFLDKLFRVVGDMRVVAGKTFSFSIKAPMFDFDFFNPVFLVGMALIAEVPGTIHSKIIFEVSCVRAVAVDAAVLNRGMDEFFPFEGFRLVGVTLKTDFVSGAVEHFGVICLMRVMTHNAPTDRYRSMDVFSRGELFVMAHKAKIGALCPELIFVRRLMRVMTLRTVAVLYRLVNGFLRIYLVVTFIAFGCDLLDRFEFVFSLVRVANGTVSDRYGSMDEFVLAHVGMAFTRDA